MEKIKIKTKQRQKQRQTKIKIKIYIVCKRARASVCVCNNRRRRKKKLSPFSKAKDSSHLDIQICHRNARIDEDNVCTERAILVLRRNSSIVIIPFGSKLQYKYIHPIYEDNTQLKRDQFKIFFFFFLEAGKIIILMMIIPISIPTILKVHKSMNLNLT